MAHCCTGNPNPQTALQPIQDQREWALQMKISAQAHTALKSVHLFFFKPQLSNQQISESNPLPSPPTGSNIPNCSRTLMKRPMTTSTAIISKPSRLNILGDLRLSSPGAATQSQVRSGRAGPGSGYQRQTRSAAPNLSYLSNFSPAEPTSSL